MKPHYLLWCSILVFRVLLHIEYNTLSMQEPLGDLLDPLENARGSYRNGWWVFANTLSVSSNFLGGLFEMSGNCSECLETILGISEELLGTSGGCLESRVPPGVFGSFLVQGSSLLEENQREVTYRYGIGKVSIGRAFPVGQGPQELFARAVKPFKVIMTSRSG